MNNVQSNRCNWHVIGSGTFDDEGRVLALDNSRPELQEIQVQFSVENSSLLQIQHGSAHLPAESKKPYYQDDCVCIADASDAPTYIMESLTNLPSLRNLDGDIEPPQLTSSSTKSSIASNDSSPVSSVCSSSNPPGYNGGRCRTSSQDDDLSCSNSCCSSDEKSKIRTIRLQISLEPRLILLQMLPVHEAHPICTVKRIRSSRQH